MLSLRFLSLFRRFDISQFTRLCAFGFQENLYARWDIRNGNKTESNAMKKRVKKITLNSAQNEADDESDVMMWVRWLHHKHEYQSFHSCFFSCFFFRFSYSFCVPRLWLLLLLRRRLLELCLFTNHWTWARRAHFSVFFFTFSPEKCTENNNIFREQTKHSNFRCHSEIQSTKINNLVSRRRFEDEKFNRKMHKNKNWKL